MGVIVAKADPVSPRFTDAFREYAQARGFVIDPARVAHPTDKPRVESAVRFVRRSFFAGENFVGLQEAQPAVERWCLTEAGMRIHGTIQARPLEVFRAEEAPRLLTVPAGRYDLPLYGTAKVHRDHHIEVAKALVLDPRQPHRPPGPGARRLQPGEGVLAWPAGQGACSAAARRTFHRPRRPALRAHRIRAPRPRSSEAAGGSGR